MHLRTAVTLLAILLLPACKTPPVSTPEAKPSRLPTAAAPKAAATPGPSLLKQPVGASTVLSGTVKLDANHIVAQGGGNIISNDGASVISNDGASAAVDQGNAIISNDGASLITNDGGSIISTNGSGIISTNGSGIISTNGSGIISTNVSGYAVLAGAGPGLGTQLPVVGAQVAVRSLITGKLLEVGKDAAGLPVTTILTNARGGFTLYLPKDLATNVRVESALRADNGAVQRYNLLTEASAVDRQLDEDSQLVTAYMEDAYASRLTTMLTTPTDKLKNSTTLAPVVELLKPFRDAAAPMLGDPAKVRLLGLRTAHALLAETAVPAHEPAYDTDDFPMAVMQAARKTNEQRHLARSFDVAVDMLGRVRLAAAQRMSLVRAGGAAPEAYFDEIEPVVAYRRLFDANFHVRYATDFGLFLVRAYLAADLTDDGGIPLGEGLRFNGLARLIEAQPPNPDAPVPARYAHLFLTSPSANAAPRLTANYQGDDALGADAIADGEAARFCTATRGVNKALIELMFGGEPADQQALHARLLAIIEDVKASR
ncbi:MAG: hypothetical protein JWM80_131 [Cyanobacteria bacterium RYN_339]|nr:hypothetical protein [Cyanobacteria bacterium RYN_339]